MYLKKKKESLFECEQDKKKIQCNNHKKVSVIVPSFKGEKHIINCLNSLKNQTLSKDLYEVIVVVNGEKDKSYERIKEFISENNLKNFILEYTETPSASNARNIGLDIANNEFITFIDDDDYVSRNYLSGMLEDAEEDSIVCSFFVDVCPSTKELKYDNYINNFVTHNSGIVEDNLNKMQPLLSTVAGKLVHKNIINNTRFNCSLISGEDVLFFSEISNRIKKIIVTHRRDVIYYRLLREGSISRKPLSFDFNVLQRLDVIRELNKLIYSKTNNYDTNFLKSRIKAQAGFIKKYIDKFPEERLKIIQIIRDDEEIKYFPFSFIFKQEKRLVFSYCFPPYNDPSGIVVMKRISEDFFNKGIISDVIHNSMNKIRKIDDSLMDFSEMFVDRKIEINAPQYFNYKAQISYAKESYKIAKQMHKKYKYKEIYSRVMWPGSHLAAFLYKLRFPKTYWVAEFSDPILYREGKIRKSGRFKYVDNFWFWLECITYLFSNKIIYTNKNQMEYMISYFPIKFLKRIIKKKSVVKKQPCLKKKYYNYNKYKYEFQKCKINIGYFGSFYKNRNISIIFEAINQLEDKVKKSIYIHVYTNNLEEINEYIIENKLLDIVKVNEYVDYFSFLNLCSNFDVLLVNDATTNNKISINPYLPSKYSDYSGSGTSIWAIIEDGSSLSYEKNIQYFSFVNSIESVVDAYNKIYNDFIKKA